MLLHREGAVSIQELSEALWEEDETDNPAGALKNLMYRLRQTMKKVFGPEKFVLTSRGSYQWNPEVPVTVDAEKFETVFEQAKMPSTTQEQRISCYEQGLELYNGHFMSKILDRHWVVTLSTYYHSMYLNGVKSLSEIYLSEKKYELVEQLVLEALKYDEVDEQLHCIMLEVYIEQNKQKQAVEYYNKASRILYDALGIKNTNRMKEIYKRILKMNKTEIPEVIEDVCEDIVEKKVDGAYICGYPVFKEFYRLEARRIDRLGESEYLLLLTLELHRKTMDEEANNYMLKMAMNHMEEVLLASLRVGDVAARYSDSQYVVLLPTCNYETSKQVAERLQTQFYDGKAKYKNIEVRSDIEGVSVANSLIQ